MDKSISQLVDDNIDLLQQLNVLLEQVPEDLFCKVDARYYQSSIGEHVRHVLDHYNCLLSGLANGFIDYDDRERKPTVEESSAEAQTRLQAVITRLQAIIDTVSADDLMQVSVSTGVSGNDQRLAADCVQRSSLARELAFLHSHTVHHNASIAILLRLSDAHQLVPQGFGLAPATIIYREQKKCAR